MRVCFGAQIKLQRYALRNMSYLSVQMPLLSLLHSTIPKCSIVPGSRWIAQHKFWAGGARRSSGTSPGVAQRRMPGSCATVLSWQKVPLRCPGLGVSWGGAANPKWFMNRSNLVKIRKLLAWHEFCLSLWRTSEL